MDDDAAVWGFYIVRADQDAPPPRREFFLWPENLPAWRLWLACSTQWLHGFNGPVGLNYEGVEVVMRRSRVPPRRRDRMFALLQAMERGALAGWSQLREQSQHKR